jgi:hypothetical protein
MLKAGRNLYAKASRCWGYFEEGKHLGHFVIRCEMWQQNLAVYSDASLLASS